MTAREAKGREAAAASKGTDDANPYTGGEEVTTPPIPYNDEETETMECSEVGDILLASMIGQWAMISVSP